MVGPTRLIRITSTGNRRRDKRVRNLKLPAVVGGVSGTIVNLSLGGASFRTESTGLENDMETDATFRFSDGDLTLPVRIISRDTDNTTEFGLSFMGLDRQSFDRIQRAVTNPLRGM